MRLNPALQNGLSIEGNLLIYDDNQIKDQVDISNFYIPEMLYNEPFRDELLTTLSAYDLFLIIKVYCQTKEVKNSLIINENTISNLKILKDNNNKEFLLFETYGGKKYRFDTTEPEKIINIYNDAIKNNKNITINEFGRLIKND